MQKIDKFAPTKFIKDITLYTTIHIKLEMIGSLPFQRNKNMVLLCIVKACS